MLTPFNIGEEAMNLTAFSYNCTTSLKYLRINIGGRKINGALIPCLAGI